MFHSGFRAHHNTETALVQFTDDLLLVSAAGAQCYTLLQTL